MPPTRPELETKRGIFFGIFMTLFTVLEATKLLGITKDAVRKRAIKRNIKCTQKLSPTYRHDGSYINKPVQAFTLEQIELLK